MTTRTSPANGVWWRADLRTSDVQGGDGFSGVQLELRANHG